MINHVYQLISPRVISIRFEDIQFADKVLVRPEYLALCHADQRYYQGLRDTKTLKKKLPMALIHECCGRVVFDPSGKIACGQKVVLVPNVPGKRSAVIFENYAQGSVFRSSGYDGFMQELISLDVDRVIPYDNIEPQVAAITEFVSVAVHGVKRFDQIAHSIRDRIGIWGDGSLAYVVANVLHILFPKSKIFIIGRQQRKLAQFSFVYKTYLSEMLPDDFSIDHAFECCGGEGSYFAIRDIIRHINPQGAMVLMGVSEHEIPINTRMVLEKGLTLVGCSRSGRDDFETAVLLMKRSKTQKRLRVIVSEDAPVRAIEDIHRVFENDLSTPFKTVFKWEL